MMTSSQRRTMKKGLKSFTTCAHEICSGCGYCMPCPHGVDIPNNFLLLNRAKLLGLEEFASQQLIGMQKNPKGDKSAMACRRCRQCLPKCPNKINIIEQLDEVKQLMK
jgi:uncharacterized protein